MANSTLPASGCVGLAACKPIKRINTFHLSTHLAAGLCQASLRITAPFLRGPKCQPPHPLPRAILLAASQGPIRIAEVQTFWSLSKQRKIEHSL